MWEQDSLKAQNEVLSGCLDGEVRALKQRKADCDETRRLSDGSNSCWSDSDGSPGNKTAHGLDIGSPALDDAGVVSTQGEDLDGEGLPPRSLEAGQQQCIRRRCREKSRLEEASGVRDTDRAKGRRGGKDRGRGGQHRDRQLGSGTLC